MDGLIYLFGTEKYLVCNSCPGACRYTSRDEPRGYRIYIHFCRFCDPKTATMFRPGVWKEYYLRYEE